MRTIFLRAELKPAHGTMLLEVITSESSGRRIIASARPFDVSDFEESALRPDSRTSFASGTRCNQMLIFLLHRGEKTWQQRRGADAKRAARVKARAEVLARA